MPLNTQVHCHHAHKVKSNEGIITLQTRQQAQCSSITDLTTIWTAQGELHMQEENQIQSGIANA